MVSAFSSRLNQGLTGREIPSAIIKYIQANETKLAGLDLPNGLQPDVAALIHASVLRAFVFGFRIVMVICAGMALVSALVAQLMIPDE